jgi:D-Tyr-tRNAtyr deacylase
MCRYLSGLFAQALGASAVAAGRFGAQMSVSLVNEGPVTFVLDL